MHTSKIILAVLPTILLVQGCSTGVSGETVIGRPGSPAWFRSANMPTQISYFTNKCRNYGFKDSTNEMAQCIQKESNEAKSLAITRLKNASQESRDSSVDRRLRNIEHDNDMRDVKSHLDKLIKR